MIVGSKQEKQRFNMFISYASTWEFVDVQKKISRAFAVGLMVKCYYRKKEEGMIDDDINRN